MRLLALLGRNGVGKTTLLKCLMGLVPVKNGSITWEGKNISHQSPHQRVKGGIAYVPQGREIFPRLTVEENILLGLSRFPGAQSKVVPEGIYQLFPVLHDMRHRRGGSIWRAAAAVGDWACFGLPASFAHFG